MFALLDFDASLQEFLARTYLGNTYQAWATALAVWLGGFLALGILKRLVHRHLQRLADRTTTDVDDLIADLVGRTKRFFLFVLALVLSHHLLDWSEATRAAEPKLSKVEVVIQDLWQVAFWAQVGFWGAGLVAFGIGRVVKGRSADDPARTMGVTVLAFVGHTIVWSIVLLSCLQALNFPVNSLIASLGVGGIAVALAAQNILGDLFASITILLDKPFVVGDGIQVGEFAGSIEHIGIKTTRIRSVNGEEIVMGNHDLVSSRIRNYKRLQERRILLSLGVEYGTGTDTIERIPALLKEIVESAPGARFDRAHFKGFGASSLDFEVVYFSQKPEYVALMDVQQSVNLAILRRFEAEGISFAFPTQTVHHVLGADEDPATAGPAVQALAAREAQRHLDQPR